MSDFLGKLQGPSKIFVHFRNQEYQTYLDISDGRMISFRNEVPYRAKCVASHWIQREYEKALYGSVGYELIVFSSDEYEAFNGLYNKMTVG